LEADDQDDLPQDLKSKAINILKAHHSLCDGVSIMCFTLAVSEEYSRDYFVKSSDSKWYQELMIKIMWPL